jgi:glycosyltransferase involved in cell wall biosynthesis/2-polyprenyl-3-methyl-5-hydroxy-6-metoxy-1,4-benzoquinol methylase
MPSNSTYKMDLSRFFEFDESIHVWVEPERAPFDYSDGEQQEQYVLDALKQSKDVSSGSAELFDRMIDWPSTYHLSPRRGNLLRPFREWFAGKRILEIGCGCGAITRFLGEAGATVVSVEGSIVRAAIARERCRDLTNVEIVCATSERANVLGEFDGVMLIGVLEYARKFLGPLGTQRLLESCRAQLSDEGVLFVAIENQLGLKYFAGAGEDHTGVPMFGIEERYSQNGVATFGREELARHISEAQFPCQQWWYPFPDYKLPLSVLNEDAVAGRLDVDFSAMITGSSAADPQRPFYQVFSPERAWQPIYRNGIGHELSNSFLVLASKQPLEVLDSPSVAFHFSVDRLPQFAKAVEIVETREGEFEVHHSRVHPNAAEISSPVLALPLDDVPFYGGEHWQHRLSLLLSTEGWTDESFFEWYLEWLHALQEEAGLASGAPLPALETRIDSRFVDALPRNLIVGDDGRRQFFDLEWRLGESIELGYLLFRGVYCSLWELRSVARPADGTTLRFRSLFEFVLGRLGISLNEADLERYSDEERNFQRYTAGRTSVDVQKVLTAELSVAPLVMNDFPRLNAEFVQKDQAIATQGAEIHRLLGVLDEKHAILAVQAAEIVRLNKHVEESSHRTAAEHDSEIRRVLGILDEKHAILAMQAAEIKRINQQLYHTAETDEAGSLPDLQFGALTNELDAKNLVVSRQAATIDQLTEYIAELEAKAKQVATHEAEVSRLTETLEDARSGLHTQAAEIDRLHRYIGETQEVVTVQSARIRCLEERIHLQSEEQGAQAEALGRALRQVVSQQNIATLQVEKIHQLEAERSQLMEKAALAAARHERIEEANLSERAEIDARRQREEAHAQQLHSELARVYAEQGALRNTKWFRLRAALTARPRSARQLARAAYLMGAMVTPGFARRSFAPAISQARALLEKPVEPAVPQLPGAPVVKQGQGATSYIVRQRKPDLAHRPRVMHVIANFMTGGSSKLVVDLIEQLGHRYQQTILTSFIPVPQAYTGVAIHELRQPENDVPFLEFFKVHTPDFIHVHYWGDCDEPWYAKAFSAAETLGIPVIENINTPVAPFVSKAVARYVYVSEYVQREFGLPEAPNKVIYPGSDFSHFSLKEGERPRGTRVGMVYRLERDKLNDNAINPFIRVAQTMPKARVLIVGGGSLLEPFKHAVAEAGVTDQFEFTGYVSYDELPALYRQMAVFVAPVWKESFGQVSPFAMNMQVPVVGYDVGAVGEIINNKNYLAPAGDANHLAKIVTRLLQNDSERNTLARSHRVRAQNYFSLEAMIGSYRTLYDEVAHRPRSNKFLDS